MPSGSRQPGDAERLQAGQVASVLDQRDWSVTPLGHPGQWPPGLASVVETCLRALPAMAIFWGRDHVLIYNDAWAQLIGERHPGAFGRPGRQVLGPLWDALAPLLELVTSSGQATARHDQCLQVERNGRAQTLYFDETFSPVALEDGHVGGVLNVAVDTTLRVQADRRQAFHHSLEAALRGSPDPESVMAASVEVLGRYLGAGRCGYAEVDAAGRSFAIATDWTDGSMPSAAGVHHIGDFGIALLDEYRAGRVVRVDDVLADPRLSPAEAAAHADVGGVRAHLSLALAREGRVVAAIFVHSAVARHWTDEEESLLAEVADRTRAAVERARAEQAMRASERLFRSFAENSRDGVWIMDARSREFDYHSPAFAAVWGLGPQSPALTLSSWREQLHPLDRETGIAHIEGLLRGEARVEEFHVVRRGDGGVRMVRDSGFPMRDPDGSVRRIAGIVRDVTEDHLLAELLRQSENRQSFLLRLGDRLRGLDDVEAIVDTTSAMLGHHLEAQRVLYADIDPATLQATVSGDWHGGRPGGAGVQDLQSFGNTFIDDLSQGRTVVIDDVATDPRVSAGAASGDPAWRSALCVPLIRGDRWASLLLVQSGAPRAWRVADIEVVQDVAERTWEAVERVRAECALRTSEERWRGIFEGMQEGFAVCEIVEGGDRPVDFRYLGVNAAWERQTGIRAESIVGRLASEVFPEIEPFWIETYRRVVETGGGVHVQQELPSLDRCFDVFAYRVEPGHLAALFLDITERKRLEDAQRASEERLRVIVENARDYAIMVTDVEGRIVDWLPGAEEVFGWSVAEAVGAPVSIVFSAEDGSRGQPELERSVAREAGDAPDVRWHVRKDGSQVFIEGTTTALRGADGELTGFLRIGQDVTQRHHISNRLAESEQRFRSMAEGMPQLVWRSRNLGHWTWASPQWLDFTGQTADQACGRGWLDAVHPDDRQATLKAWDDAEAQGMLAIEHRIHRAADGAWLWHRTRSAPVRDETGRAIEWLGTTTDVQDMKELEARQGVLVAELQHRTRNLIAVVRSLAEKTLRESTTLDGFQACFRDRMAALARVQGLLSRSSGSPRVTFDELLHAELAAHGTHKGDAARVVLDGPTGVRLRPSAVQTLSLAIHELATNAVKYGALAQPQGRLQVRWRVSGADAGDGPELHVEWSESGVCMPAGEGGSPQQGGYGRELIEKALPYQLNARTRYEVGADGIRCTIDLPLATGEAGVRE